MSTFHQPVQGGRKSRRWTEVEAGRGVEETETNLFKELVHEAFLHPHGDFILLLCHLLPLDKNRNQDTRRAELTHTRAHNCVFRLVPAHGRRSQQVGVGIQPGEATSPSHTPSTHTHRK